MLVLLACEETRGFARRAVPCTVVPQGDGVVVLDDDVALVISVCSWGVFGGRGVGKCRIIDDRCEVGFEEVDIGEIVVLGVGAAETDHDLEN